MAELPSSFGEVPERKVKFADSLSALCAFELCRSEGDHERRGEMIERLLSSLAFTIAMAAKGDPRGMEEMLRGAEAYLYECAAGHAKIASTLEAAKRTVR